MGNISRSQMAQAMFNHYKKDYHVVDKNYEAISAGVAAVIHQNQYEGNRSINRYISRHVKELGIDISDPEMYHPKMLTKEMLDKSKIKIALDSFIGSAIMPEYNIEIDENWRLQDRLGQDRPESDEIRNQLKERVLGLIKNLYGETSSLN